jgi:hypothetical protein
LGEGRPCRTKCGDEREGCGHTVSMRGIPLFGGQTHGEGLLRLRLRLVLVLVTGGVCSWRSPRV